MQTTCRGSANHTFLGLGSEVQQVYSKFFSREERSKTFMGRFVTHWRLTSSTLIQTCVICLLQYIFGSRFVIMYDAIYIIGKYDTIDDVTRNP